MLRGEPTVEASDHARKRGVGGVSAASLLQLY